MDVDARGGHGARDRVQETGLVARGDLARGVQRRHGVVERHSGTPDGRDPHLGVECGCELLLERRRVGRALRTGDERLERAAVVPGREHSLRDVDPGAVQHAGERGEETRAVEGGNVEVPASWVGRRGHHHARLARRGQRFEHLAVADDDRAGVGEQVPGRSIGDPLHQALVVTAQESARGRDPLLHLEPVFARQPRAALTARAAVDAAQDHRRRPRARRTSTAPLL